jgi:hypothetical protein
VACTRTSGCRSGTSLIIGPRASGPVDGTSGWWLVSLTPREVRLTRPKLANVPSKNDRPTRTVRHRRNITATRRRIITGGCSEGSLGSFRPELTMHYHTPSAPSASAFSVIEPNVGCRIGVIGQPPSQPENCRQPTGYVQNRCLDSLMRKAFWEIDSIMTGSSPRQRRAAAVGPRWHQMNKQCLPLRPDSDIGCHPSAKQGMTLPQFSFPYSP